MSVTEIISVAMKEFKKEQKDTPNWKPNRILLSPSVYNDYKKEKGYKSDEDVTFTFEGVHIVRNEGQADPIFLEKRKFHK